MKYTCNTCGARYAIPEERVKDAGENGLRVRCSRCRSIMAVSLVDMSQAAKGDDDITQPLGVRRKKRRASHVGEPLGTEVGMSAADVGPAPAMLSTSGVYRPLPGVDRAVTGLHMPKLAAAMPGRDWYAAFGGRARGPYSRVELELLAEQGRVRSSTLIWRPGFDEWRRVRAEGNPRDDELAWLRSIVEERKRQERAASDKAAREHGIHRLHLEDLAGPVKTPPPLPAIEYAELVDGSAKPKVLLVGKKLPSEAYPSHGDEAGLVYAADQVFGATRFGALPLSKNRAPGRGWRRRRAVLAGALLVALGVVLAAYTLPALGVSSPVVEALVSLLR